MSRAIMLEIFFAPIMAERFRYTVSGECCFVGVTVHKPDIQWYILIANTAYMEGLTGIEHTETSLVSIKHPETVRTEPPRHTNQSQPNTNLTAVSVCWILTGKKLDAPPRIPVTTRIIYLVGDPDKPLVASVNGKREHPKNSQDMHIYFYIHIYLFIHI